QLRANSALAGDCNIFVAMAMGAVCAGFGDGAGNFVGIDPAIGRGLGEIPRLAVAARDLRAAFLAPGEALVDAVAVRLVIDDEDAGLGRCSGRSNDEGTGEEREQGSHDAPGGGGTASSRINSKG